MCECVCEYVTGGGGCGMCSRGSGGARDWSYGVSLKRSVSLEPWVLFVKIRPRLDVRCVRPDQDEIMSTHEHLLRRAVHDGEGWRKTPVYLSCCCCNTK